MDLLLANSQVLETLKKYPVVGAYFYGSKLTGKSNALSDLDLGVLLADEVSPKKYFRLRLEIQDALGKILKEEVDLAILNEASPLLAQNVITKGKLIFCPNKSKTMNFACQTLKKYDDALFLMKTYHQHLKTRASEGRLGETKK